MTQIRLATYNIHGAVGRDRRCDPGRIAEVINEMDADVVALQEVVSHHGDLGMLEFLSEETGMCALAGPTMLRTVGEYGNALLARCHIAGVQRIDLSVPGREPRGALDVLLEYDDASLRVLSAHLGLNPAERRHQVRTLLARLDPDDAGPIVLMGDLNEWFLWGGPLRRLHEFFVETPAIATFPACFPVFALDRLWTKPNDRLRSLFAHKSPLARRASDHLPLVATIEV